MVDYELLRLQYFQNELPCPYKLSKGTQLLIYPITVEDFFMYLYSKDVMEIDKNNTTDIKIIQMSYLEFLVKHIFVNNDTYVDKFLLFFRMILHEENINITEDNHKFYVTISKETEDGFVYKHIINSKELEEISKISFFQNEPDYDDTIYSPDIKKAMEDYYRLKYKGSSPSLERQKAYVISKTGFTVKDINKMIYRTFNLVYKSCVDSEIYLTQKIIESSPKYETKGFTPHPLFEKPKNRLDEIFSQTDDDLRSKIH